MIKYLLDTDTFSQLAKGIHPGIAARAGALPADEVALSVITAGEIRFGLALHPVRAALRRQIDQLLGIFAVLGLDADAAPHYAKVRTALARKGTPIGPNDLWIAAQALTHKLVLVTNNTREFSRVPQLKIENWLA